MKYVLEFLDNKIKFIHDVTSVKNTGKYVIFKTELGDVKVLSDSLIMHYPFDAEVTDTSKSIDKKLALVKPLRRE